MRSLFNAPETAVAVLGFFGFLVQLRSPVFACPCLHVISAQESCQFPGFVSGTPQIQDSFGNALDMEDTQLVIGSFLGNSGTGEVFIYDQCSSVWSLTEVLRPSTPGAAALGADVKIMGSDLVVGAVFDAASGQPAGAAHIYRRVGDSYVLQDVVTPSVPQTNMVFGATVSFDSTNRIIVAAPMDSTVIGNSGTVFVFEELLGQWAEVQRIPAPEALGSELFGEFIDTRSDGLMAVGAPTTGDIEANLGTVYLYRYMDNLGYVLDQRLNPSDTADGWHFGTVALGDTCLAVGAPLFDSPSGRAAGGVFLFEEDQGIWNETEILMPSDSTSGAEFGISVAIDGEWMAVGAGGDSSTAAGAGAVYLFQYIAGVWVEMEKLVAMDASVGDALGDAVFGHALALEADLVAAGAPRKDDGAMDAGAAYAWSISGLGCSTLRGQPETLSLSLGGQQILSMDLGSSFASRTYFLIGTTSGTMPGFFFSDACIPLNPDSYFISTLTPNSPPLSSTAGLLNAQGKARAQLTLPPNSDPSLVGNVLEHLFVVFSLGPLAIAHVSIPATLLLDR